MPDPILKQQDSEVLNSAQIVEVNVGTEAEPVWKMIHWITDCVFKDESNYKDSGTYDSSGYESQSKTSAKWSIEVEVLRGLDEDGAYDEAQQFCKAASKAFGKAHTVQVRYCEVGGNSPRSEGAVVGKVNVAYLNKGGSWDDTAKASITFTGRGAYTTVAHPYPLPAA